MRLPRMTIKRWMSVVAVAALLVFLIPRSRTHSIGLGVGNKVVTMVFVVTDADSGKPIDGASIHLRTLDLLEIAQPPYTVDMSTRTDGRASFSVDLITYIHHDPMRGNRLAPLSPVKACSWQPDLATLAA